MIHVICDSTCAMTAEESKAYPNLHLIPLQICFDGKYEDDPEVTIDQVIEYSERTKKAIPTSQPSTGDFLKAFESIPEEDGIIVLCVTSAVSGTYNGACLAAKQSGRKQIAVIDSRTTAIGMVQLMQDAFEYIDAGLSFEEVEEKVRAATFRMRTSFTVDTLDYLRRGGRVGKAAGFIAGILKIKPVIYLNPNNEVDVLDKARTTKKAYASMMDFLHRNSPAKRIGVVHLQNPEGAELVRSKIQAEYPDVPVTVTTGTAVLSVYLGPGLVAVIFESAE